MLSDQLNEKLDQSGALSLLRIDEDAVVDENDEVVLLVAGHVGHGAFARFGQRVLRAAKRVLLEHLPAVAGHQLAVFVERNEIEMVFRRLHKDELFASAAVRIVSGAEPLIVSRE